ncbi:aspartyl/asparaginyl beta-hydroxylase domain-containing protein [Streptomyces sp. NPDC057445]|uniref:aspartyl/asparaginyl beta-hydroxylase domain-containing protein n=1 Tax=Streptomyces sp. NPDC057445 TaxID=3346136 RepID=UPI0036A3C6B7
MTPEIEEAFEAIRRTHGERSLDRVEAMLDPEGQKRHPLQRDAKWVMPGISERPWHDPYEHPEVAPVVRAFESGHAAIKEELAAAWAQRRGQFSDYEHYLVRQNDWQALYLYKRGRLMAESEPLVPTAYRILRETAVDTGAICPLLESHFSTLLPGAAIRPHCDLWNFSINLHVAVDIPEDCGIRVAGEARPWKEGECLLFDYSFEHEAWNHGARPRTCLLVDLWHPETTLPEREALVALVTEIRALTGEG